MEGGGNYPYNKYQALLGADEGSENNLDILAIVRKLSRRWYFFALTIPIFLSLGYYKIKTSNKIYSVGATMIINEGAGYNNLGESEFLKGGIRLLQKQENLENEIGILTSFKMAEKAIRRLDYDVGYYKVDKWKTRELYKSTPFEVNYDINHEQMIGVAIWVRPLSESDYWLEIEIDDDFNLMDPLTETTRELNQPFTYSQKHRYGKPVVHDFFRFTINRTDYPYDDPDGENKFLFVINHIPSFAEAYQGKVVVTTIGEEGTIISLETEGEVIQKEIDYLNTLAATYIETKLEEKNAYASGTIDFIEGQLSSVSDSLQGAEMQLANFRRGEQAIDLEAKATDAITEMRNLNRQKSTLEVSNRYYRALLNDLTDSASINSIVAPQTIGITNPLLNQLVIDLKKLNTEKIQKSFMVNEGSMEMDMINRQIESARGALVENVRSIISSTKFTLDDLNIRIAKLKAIMRRLPRSEMEQFKIKRRFNLSDNLYNYLLQRRAEAGIQKAANKADSRILDEARMVGDGPVSPKKFVIMATMLMLALFFPTIFILLADLLDNKVRNEDQIRSLTDVKVLASIPHIEKNLDMFHPEFVMSPLAESFRYLKVNLDYILPTHLGRRVIGVTSMVKGEGKTFTSTHLAATLALSGKKTIIIGADIRRPQLYKRLEVPNEFGLSNYLAYQVEIEDIIQTTQIKNLSALPSGQTPPNLAELLNSDRLAELFENLTQAYDYVLVDTPPVGLVSDYLTLSKYIDLNLFVVRQKYSKLEFIKEAGRLTENNKVNNLYFVFNDVSGSSGRAYSGKYGRRYSYGYGEDKPKGTKRIWRKLVKKA